MPRKQSKKKRNPELVIIEWLDAFDGHSGWVDPKEYKPFPMNPVTVGWLIPDFMEGHLTIMGTYLLDRNSDNEVHYSTPSHIPLGMVQSITYLDVPDTIKDASVT